MEASIYDFEVKNIYGELVSLSKYKGRPMLIINTASNCGFTNQFEGLEELYKRYKNDGLAILGFPCNQFNNQEPGDENSIIGGCMINYGVTFDMYAKVNVNGKDAHPLFVYLKKELPGFLVSKIKWNFTKFLIDSEGNAVKRFSPITTPKQIEKEIIALIKK